MSDDEDVGPVIPQSFSASAASSSSEPALGDKRSSVGYSDQDADAENEPAVKKLKRTKGHFAPVLALDFASIQFQF